MPRVRPVGVDQEPRRRLVGEVDEDRVQRRAIPRRVRNEDRVLRNRYCVVRASSSSSELPTSTCPAAVRCPTRSFSPRRVRRTGVRRIRVAAGPPTTVWGNCLSRRGKDDRLPTGHSLSGARNRVANGAQNSGESPEKFFARVIDHRAHIGAQLFNRIVGRVEGFEAFIDARERRREIKDRALDILSEEADRALERGVGHAQRPPRGFGGRLGSAAESVSELVEFRKP